MNDRSSSDKNRLTKLLARSSNGDNVFIHEKTSHGELHISAAQLYQAMTAKTSGPVALATSDKSLIAATLLAWWAGGPPLLLPYSPSRRALERMREIIDFTWVITDDPDFVMPEVSILCLQGRQKNSLPPVPSTMDGPENLLSIFTGGTTGSPQLWSKTGANIFGEALFLARHFGIDKNDRILSTVPPHHIYGLLFSVVLPLVSGASVIDTTPSFPAEISDAAQQHQPTILVAVPAHYRVLMEHSLPANSLRLAFSSAGMLGEKENNAFYAQNKIPVIEVFGSTETGGIAERNRSRDQGCFTAFPDVEYQVRSQRLAVRSPFLSPDLSVDEKGFFLTADKVKICPNGGFVLQGRSDQVTKVGGKRVDLDEIRTLILARPEVSDCLLLAMVEKGGRGHRIGGLIQGKDIDPGTLKQYLRDSLDPQAIPKIFKIIDRIPIKENGKYDRQAALALLRQ